MNDYRPIWIFLRQRPWLRGMLPPLVRSAIRHGVDHVRDAIARVDGLRLAATRQTRPPKGVGRVLVIDDLVPDPLFGSGFPRAFAIVQGFVRAGYRIDFYPMRSRPSDIARMDQKFEGQVQFHAGMGARGLRRLLWRQGHAFTMIFVSRPLPMAAFIASGWRPRDRSAPFVVYDAEAVITPREARQRALFGNAWSPDEEDKALAAELMLAQAADAVTAVTPADRSLIAARVDPPVFLLAHPVISRSSTSSFVSRRDLLFVGRLTGSTETSPNVDSILWFIAQVMPLLDSRIGTDYKLHVVGMLDAPEIDAFVSSRVILHGAVERLEPFYDHSRLFVAPTRYAAGLPLKVVESMGQGLPCVGTPLLAEQVGVTGHGFAADISAEAFADRCAMLYTDPRAWEAARLHGIAHSIQYFSQNAFIRAFDVLLAQMSRTDTAGE